MTGFQIPTTIASRDYSKEYEKLLVRVNPVNHGEFEAAVEAVLRESRKNEAQGLDRANVLAIQRCRRGGKTFMLHAIAAMLQNDQRLKDNTHIIFISMNCRTPYEREEDARTAVLSRVAFEMIGRDNKSFFQFCERYKSFHQVEDWLNFSDKKVILLVDELNVIPPTSKNYRNMSNILDIVCSNSGCALLYSTHQRETVDSLRGREIPKRQIVWLNIPRFVNQECLQGMLKAPTDGQMSLSFWSTILRGRIPALMVVDQINIPGYAQSVFQISCSPEELQDERKRSLGAVITGDISHLPNGRGLFRAYSYMSERFNSIGRSSFVWPPFMVAQESVLGKDYRILRRTLEDPSVDDEAKAFEALTQLSILVRLLSDQHHKLVPHHPGIANSIEETAMFHVADSALNLDAIVDEVRIRFRDTKVLQVVAVPLFASFPIYDFFLMHYDKEKEDWKVAAGYQCKLGKENPTEDAWTSKVPLSVWLEGKCRKYRVEADGERVEEKKHRGWTLLGASNQMNMLGMSVVEALPQDPTEDAVGDTYVCGAAKSWNDAQNSERKRKAESI